MQFDILPHIFLEDRGCIYLNIKLFMWAYNLHRKFEAHLNMEDGWVSGKSRGVYAILDGFAKAGIYWLS